MPIVNKQCRSEYANAQVASEHNTISYYIYMANLLIPAFLEAMLACELPDPPSAPL
jgi:hypothetical protein